MRIDLRLRDDQNPPMAHEYRVLLDGEDVSRNCFLCDDITGEVGLYLRDETGHFYLDYGQGAAAQEFRRGEVVMWLPEQAKATS